MISGRTDAPARTAFMAEQGALIVTGPGGESGDVTAHDVRPASAGSGAVDPNFSNFSICSDVSHPLGKSRRAPDECSVVMSTH